MDWRGLCLDASWKKVIVFRKNAVFSPQSPSPKNKLSQASFSALSFLKKQKFLYEIF